MANCARGPAARTLIAVGGKIVAAIWTQRLDRRGRDGAGVVDGEAAAVGHGRARLGLRRVPLVKTGGGR
jgi:hypothetical protein